MNRRFILVLYLSLLLLDFGSAYGAEKVEKKLSVEAQKAWTEGLKAAQEKKPEEALKQFKKVIELEPNFEIAYFNVGVLQWQQQQMDDAITNFETALKLKPDYANAANVLRQSLYEAAFKMNAKQEFQKSNEYLLKLISLPDMETAYKSLFGDALYLLGFNNYNLRQNKESLEYFGKLSQIPGLEKDNFETYANTLYFMGGNNHFLEQYQESNNHFKSYLELFSSGDHQSSFLGHANLFIGTNLWRLLEKDLKTLNEEKVAAAATEIIPYLNKAIEMNIPIEDAYVMLGNCYVYIKNYEEALKNYKALVERFPQSPEIAKYQAFIKELEKMIQAKADAAKKGKRK